MSASKLWQSLTRRIFNHWDIFPVWRHNLKLLILWVFLKTLKEMIWIFVFKILIIVNVKVAANFVLCMKIVCLWESSIIKLLAHTSPTFFKSQPYENFFQDREIYDFKSTIFSDVTQAKPNYSLLWSTSLPWTDEKNDVCQKRSKTASEMHVAPRIS